MYQYEMKAIAVQYIHFSILGKDVCINFNNAMIIKMAINIKSGILLIASTEGIDITHNFDESYFYATDFANNGILFRQYSLNRFQAMVPTIPHASVLLWSKSHEK